MSLGQIQQGHNDILSERHGSLTAPFRNCSQIRPSAVL
jgi:hypothetical protein